MKVVFLDIDGVLNTHKTNALFGPTVCVHKDAATRLDPLGVKFFNMLHQLGIKIVLSSTWRLGRDVPVMTEKTGIPIYDKTCSWPFKDSVRGDEIKIWLDAHPEVTHYCIVDDDSDMLEEQKANFIKTQYEEGLTYKDMCDICKCLGFEIWDIRKQLKIEDCDEVDGK